MKMEMKKLKPVPMFTKRRLGRFRITKHLLFVDPVAAKKIFSNMIVIRCEYLIHIPAFEYYAYSDLFEPVDYGKECPMYEINIKKLDRRTIISVSKVE